MTYVRSRRLGVTVVPYQAVPAPVSTAPVTANSPVAYVPPVTSYVVATPTVTAPLVPVSTAPTTEVVTPVTGSNLLTATQAAVQAATQPAVAQPTGETSTAPLPGGGSATGAAGRASGGLPWGWILAGVAGVGALWLVTR